MNGPTTLERWYRRALVAYPSDVRARRGDELVGVLLDCAPADQRLPRPGELANLVAHGLRARARARRLAARGVAPTDLYPTPSSAPLPQTYGQALRTLWPSGFRPTIEDWNWRRPPRWLKVVLALLIVAGGAGVGVGLYRYFVGYAPFATAEQQPQSDIVRVGHTIWVGPGVRLAAGDDGQLKIDSVTANVTRNTAGATITIERCLSGIISYESWDAEVACGATPPFVPHTEPDTDGSSHSPVALIVAVTPHRPGVVHIDGVTIRAHDGWRTSSQHLGTRWTINARP